MQYSHTQRAPLYFVILAPALLLFAVAFLFAAASIAIIMLLSGTALLMLAFCFRTLTVSDEGERLSVRFGPVRLFGTSIPYSEITRVEPGRSSIIDGWGIHYMPGRGRIYNLWGYSCAVVYLEQSIVRIGTDDVENLVDFLIAKSNVGSA